MNRVVAMAGVALMLAVIAAGDGLAATKKKAIATPKKYDRAWCQSLCRKAYGPTANVLRVSKYNGKPFCWCT